MVINIYIHFITNSKTIRNFYIEKCKNLTVDFHIESSGIFITLPNEKNIYLLPQCGYINIISRIKNVRFDAPSPGLGHMNKAFLFQLKELVPPLNYKIIGINIVNILEVK